MPLLIKPSEISKINLGASYISFSIKEIYENLNMSNTEKGKIVYKWKKKIENLYKMQREEVKLKKLIEGKFKLNLTDFLEM